MQYRLKNITPPEIEPVTLAEVKLHAHIDHSVQDSIINSWIKGSRTIVEAYQRRALIGQIWEMSFDCFPALPIDLPMAPLMQLISIKYIDCNGTETTLYYDGYNPVSTTEEGGDEPSTNSEFIVDTSGSPGRLSHAYSCVWPSVVLRPIDAVKIRFACGYGIDREDVPENVRDAIMLYCTYMNENRAGEVIQPPRQFFDLIAFDRMYV